MSPSAPPSSALTGLRDRLGAFSRGVKSAPSALRRALAPHKPWLLLSLFALAVSWEYSAPAPERSWSSRPEAHGDGNYYYAYLRSIVFDHDVELTNDYFVLGDQFGYGIHAETKRARNVFSIGPALFWLPFVPVAHAGQWLAEKLGAPPDQLDGTESLYQRSIMFGSVLAGLLTTALGIWLARRITDDGLATLTGIGLCLGSPLIWYMLRQPSFSHAIDSAVLALFATAWLASYGSRALLRWAGVGALLGFAMLVRPQNVTHTVLPLVEWLLIGASLLRSGARRELPRHIVSGFVFVFAALVMVAPLLLIWRRMFGTWTLVPQGSDFMLWASSRWDAALFASRGGLFAFHPLLLLSAMGLIALPFVRGVPRELRIFAVCGLLVLALQAYINGAAKDWWGGWAFGGRRFLSCIIYFMAGLATVLELIRRFAVAHTKGFIQFASALFLLAIALYNRSLADDFLHLRMAVDGTQPMKPRYAAALTKTLDEVYALTGNPGSFPANLLFARRGGTSPEQFDVVSGNDFLEVELNVGRGFGMDDFHALHGFGPWFDHKGRQARKVVERKAAFVIVLRLRAQLEGNVAMSASHPGTRVQMYLNRKRILDARPTTEWADYPLKIPEEATSTGLNYITIVQRLPKPDAFVSYAGGGVKRVLPPLLPPPAPP